MTSKEALERIKTNIIDLVEMCGGIYEGSKDEQAIKLIEEIINRAEGDENER